jgi:hypothetical protein
MSKAFASLPIQVGIPPEEETEAEGIDRSLEIQMADELNLDSEGKPKSEFFFGDYAYFRVIASDRETPYMVETNWGTLFKHAAEATFDTEQSVTFAKTRTGSLTYPPAPNTAPSYRWIGKQPPGVAVTFSGQDVKLSADAIGVLQISYKAVCDIWYLWVRYPFIGEVTYDGLSEETEEGTVTHPLTVSIVVASQEEASASTSVSYKAEGDGGTAEEYEALVVMQCSGDPVDGAKVYFRGEEYTVGADGLCNFGLLSPGTYAVAVSYEGQTHNYSFTVGTPEDEADDGE